MSKAAALTRDPGQGVVQRQLRVVGDGYLRKIGQLNFKQTANILVQIQLLKDER